MAAAKTPAIELQVGERSVRVSNPDKVYFPALGEAGGTKRHLVEYYLSVGDGIVRALHDRPTYLQRFPDGVEGEEIYQKRVPTHAPDWIRTCQVTFPSGRTADALRVTEPADVAWAANLGTVTFHPWHARCSDVDRPDELRIDLDPQPGTDFDDARAVAVRCVQPLLAELGWVGFPKTSGNRGLHVYVRIEPRWTFTEVRHAAIAFAREVERRDPAAVTTKWWKEERGTRVFVDFNQNARDRTIASAYSARRRVTGTVSTPLRWDEVADVETEDFTIATVPARFAEARRRARHDRRRRSRPHAVAGVVRAGRARPRRGGHAVSPELPQDAGRADARATEPREALTRGIHSARSMR